MHVFLLYAQVIEYIQFLQEKLNMYEGSYQGWSTEPTKLTPWVIIVLSGMHMLLCSRFCPFAWIVSLCSFMSF